MNQLFLAADAHDQWRKQIAGAAHSVCVFTPYLDSELGELISYAPEGCERVVITDLSPETASRSYLAKLSALLGLLDDGVQILALERLHAKVLLTDNHEIAAGSQNFTTFGRGSKEVTTFGIAADALPTLEQWKREASHVSREFLEALLASIVLEAEELELAQTNLETKFKELERAFQVTRATEERVRALQSFRKKLKHSIDRSPLAPAEGKIWLTPDSVRDQWGDYYDVMKPVDSLWSTSSSAIDLTRWRMPSQVVELTRLRMYPILNASSGAMGFIRVGKGRVTYVRRSLLRTDGVVVNGRRLTLGIDFKENPEAVPQPGSTDLLPSNVTVTLYKGEVRVHSFELSFNGASVQFLSDGRVRPWLGTQADVDLLRQQLQEPSSAGHIFADLVRSFKYRELGAGNKNVASFFRGRNHEVYLIQFFGRHIFIAQ